MGGSFDQYITTSVHEPFHHDIPPATAGSRDDDASATESGPASRLIQRTYSAVVLETVIFLHHLVIFHGNLDVVDVGESRQGGLGDDDALLKGTDGWLGHADDGGGGMVGMAAVGKGGVGCGASGVVVVVIKRHDDRRMFVALSEGMTVAHVDVQVRSASVLSWT